MNGGSAETAVVVPVYGNAPTLRGLHDRIRDALAGRRLRIVFVDDASPDDSATELEALRESDPEVEVVSLDRNRGQHRAVLAGLARVADAEFAVTLDADLQDPPEALPKLLAALEADDRLDVVFGGRRGAYQSRGRSLTGAAYRRVLSAVSGLPKDAGMLMALRGTAVKRVLELRGPEPQVVAMVGRADLATASVPVVRSTRPAGVSAYGSLARARSAARALRWALDPAVGTPRPQEFLERHNRGQRTYFADPDRKPRMRPRPSRYLERHVDELIRFAGLRPGERVLEVGCGMGRHTFPLARRGLEVEAIDLSEELLATMRDRAESAGILLHHGDVISPPAGLRPGFDAVLGTFVLHHMHDLDASMRAMADLLRPGGRLAFLEPNALNPLFYAQVAVTPGMTWSGDGGIASMRRGRLTSAVESAGVPQPEFERFGFFPPAVSERRRGAALERHVERVPGLGPFLAFQLVGGRVPGAQPS